MTTQEILKRLGGIQIMDDGYVRESAVFPADSPIQDMIQEERKKLAEERESLVGLLAKGEDDQ